MNGHQRIRAVLENRDGAAFLPFLTAGLPTPAASADLFVAMADAGADAFEVGIPYSDPLMDGPVIMQASQASLSAGTNIRVALQIIGEVVARTGKPVLAMTYANPVMQIGWEAFVQRLEGVGAAGIIVPDLPLEECGPLLTAAAASGLGVVQFVSPTSNNQRIDAVAAANPAFIYGVADMGVTGERASNSAHAQALSERVRDRTSAPPGSGCRNLDSGASPGGPGSGRWGNRWQCHGQTGPRGRKPWGGRQVSVGSRRSLRNCPPLGTTPRPG